MRESWLTLIEVVLAAVTGLFLCWEEANQAGLLTPSVGHCLSDQPSTKASTCPSTLTEISTKTWTHTVIPVTELINRSLMHQKSYRVLFRKSGSGLWMVVSPAILSCGPEEREREMTFLGCLLGYHQTCFPVKFYLPCSLHISINDQTAIWERLSLSISCWKSKEFMFGVSFEFVIVIAPLISVLIYATWEFIPSMLGWTLIYSALSFYN